MRKKKCVIGSHILRGLNRIEDAEGYEQLKEVYFHGGKRRGILSTHTVVYDFIVETQKGMLIKKERVKLVSLV